MKNSFLAFFKLLFSKKPAFQKKLKKQLGFYPGNLSLYEEAFRHRSSLPEIPEDLLSNERLEFLGDAVIELVVRNYLFQRFPDKSEGELTDIRVKIVNRDFLNELGEKMKLEDLIRVEEQSKDKLLNESASIHGNVVEALTGAVFLDKGYNKAKDFFLNKVLQNAGDLDEIIHTRFDYKSLVIQWSQKWDIPVKFRVINDAEEEGFFVCALYLNEKKVGEGTGRKKKKAENDAARNAYENGQFRDA